MKPLLATLALSLFLPTTGYAYFIKDVSVPRTNEPMAPQYVPEPVNYADWPSWIGRLDALSNFVYDRSFRQLTPEQREYIQELSDTWPSWIGIPSYWR